jgi:hypothetical protein
METLTNRELESLAKDCSSVKGIKNGQIIWKERAVLNQHGQLLPMAAFHRMEYSYPQVIEKVKKNADEFNRLKRAKSKWKKNFSGIVYKGPFDRSIIKHLYAYILN